MPMTPPPTCEVRTEDVEYLRHDGTAQRARLYLPQGEGPFPLVAEVHGGAWCQGDRQDDARLHTELAHRGIAVAALDFRMPPQAGYPASLADLHYAMRWLKAQAAQWRCRPDAVGIMGLSSGGHQAMLLAMRPFDARYAALALPQAPEINAMAGFVVLLWPIVDPLGHYHYALALQASGPPYPADIDRVIPEHLRYWGNETAMAEGSPVLALARGEEVLTPPVLVLQGARDFLHPREHLERFAHDYRAAGGTLSLRWFPNEAEGFVNTHPDAPSTAEAIDTIVQFVQARAAALP